jgi:hypothetical protein
MIAVYLETSFISACVSTRRDSGSRYRQNTSLDWWRSFGSSYELFLSQEVLEELKHPSFKRSSQALGLVAGIPLLDIDDDVRGVAAAFVKERVMPTPVAGDAIHVATAAVHGVEYVLSWNVRHLANPRKVRHLETICHRLALVAPKIVTPEFLWEKSA